MHETEKLSLEAIGEVRRGQRENPVCEEKPLVGLRRLCGAIAGPVGVRPSEQSGAGPGAAHYREDDRIEPGAGPLAGGISVPHLYNLHKNQRYRHHDYEDEYLLKTSPLWDAFCGKVRAPLRGGNMPAFILDTSRHGAQRVFRDALSKLRQNRALSDCSISFPGIRK